MDLRFINSQPILQHINRIAYACHKSQPQDLPTKCRLAVTCIAVAAQLRYQHSRQAKRTLRRAHGLHRGTVRARSAALHQRAAELRREAAQLEVDLHQLRAEEKLRFYSHFAGPGAQHLHLQHLCDALQDTIGAKVTPALAEKVLQHHDMDGDGVLGLEEFHKDAVLNTAVRLVRQEQDAAAAAERAARAIQEELKRKEQEISARHQLVASMPPPNEDVGWCSRFCAILPYLVPAIDACQRFGLAVAFQRVPELHTSLVELGAGCPSEIQFAMAVAPMLAFPFLSILANQRRLPQLIRFNLFQAWIFELMVLIGCAGSSALHWLSIQFGSEEVLYVPAGVQPTEMPGGEVIFLMAVAGVVYSVACTLLGKLPEHVPLISSEAMKSMGTAGPKSRHRSHKGGDDNKGVHG